ncbi:uncharacterized protein TNCV_3799371 [Trichonephila clavipes]|nr:uncharacterized protein TNCV_3799371 [Trichonephila clavipes]
MDVGSQRSHFEQGLVGELTFSQGLFGGGISPAVEHGRYIVTIESLDRKYSTKMSLLDQQKICSILLGIRDKSLLCDLAL